MSAFHYVCPICRNAYGLELSFEGKRRFHEHKVERHSY